MLRRVQHLLRLDRLERRLFGWLLLLTLVPVFTLVTAGYLLSARSLEWVGTFGPWDRVADSGRALVEAVEPLAATDSTVAAALDAHRRELSASVQLSRRWRLIGERLQSLLPAAAFLLAVLLAALALWVGRRLAVQLARPIKELALWADMLASNEPLPPPAPREEREVREVRALRESMRLAAVSIAENRARAVETERVRAWGEMARRVAHEMKNPLTPLRLAAHRLTRHPDADGTLREPIEVIEEETGRLDELARQFAVLGRPSTGPVSDVDLVELLQTLLDSDVPPHITTRLDAAAGTPLLRGHYDALQRAFRNLIRNAVEAVDAAARAAPDGRHAAAIHVTVERDADGLVVAIRDTGVGLPAEHAERLFEADFTLKAGGTGLGLAVVRQAVAAHGGIISAAPAPDGGALFTTRLPLAGPAD